MIDGIDGNRARRAVSARHPLISKLMAPVVTGVLLVFCLLGVIRLAQEASQLFELDEAGYGDSYILYDVQQFQQSGRIYRDPSEPPYLPTQYSPLVYILLSIPDRFARWESPFVGPRLIVLVAFALCVGILGSIARTLISSRFVWIWAILLASSISAMWSWVLQIRADFIATSCSLLAIRLLLSRSPGAVVAAGVCAGLALELKLTFAAAALAGASWLLSQRKWADLVRFTAAAALAATGFYVLYYTREPRMLSQMLALNPGIVDVKGNLKLMYQTAREPLVLLALLAVPLVIKWKWPRWRLIVLFAAMSFLLAGLADLQAGGADNYYFEPLFALVPIAVPGVLLAVRLARRHVDAGLLLIGLFAVHFLPPRIQEIRGGYFRAAVDVRNDAFRAIEAPLRGRLVLATVPRFALLSSHPPLMEPYLYSYLRRLGKVSTLPFVDGVQKAEYEAVITHSEPQSWRGVLHVDPDLRQAIAASYEPYCRIANPLIHTSSVLVHLPRFVAAAAKAWAIALTQAGCEPVSGTRIVW